MASGWDGLRAPLWRKAECALVALSPCPERSCVLSAVFADLPDSLKGPRRQWSSCASGQCGETRKCTSFHLYAHCF